MMFIAHQCPCGAQLRYDSKRGYVPLAGSAAALTGHVPAIVVRDGESHTVLPDAVCAAAPESD